MAFTDMNERAHHFCCFNWRNSECVLGLLFSDMSVFHTLEKRIEIKNPSPANIGFYHLVLFAYCL